MEDKLKVKLQEVATIKSDKVDTDLLSQSIKDKQKAIKSDKIINK